MAGASEVTKRVRNVNLNWAAPDGTGPAAEVEALLVTEDDERHSIALAATEVAGFVAMVTASPVLLFDPRAQTVIAANIVGEWLPAYWTSAMRGQGSSDQ